MIRREDESPDRPRVYALAVFELDDGAAYPADKAELLDLLSAGKAITFHQRVVGKRHAVPDAEKWMLASKKDLKGETDPLIRAYFSLQSFRVPT